MIALAIVVCLVLNATFWTWAGLHYTRSRAEAQQAREQAAREIIASLEEQNRRENNELLSKEEVLYLYEPRFKALENIALQRLEELYDEAVEEYEARRKKGSFDRMRFGNEYLQKGQELEKTFDTAFKTLLGELEEKMETNNLPPAAYEEVETELKDLYDQAKDEKKQELINKVRDKLIN